MLPTLISYPRCGAHWLSTIIELYLDKPYLCPGNPSGRVTFLDRDRTDWGFYHTHDRDCKEVPISAKNRVLYLYRNNIDVVFSMFFYERYTQTQDESVYDTPEFDKHQELIWTIDKEYRRHLGKWLSEVNHVVEYERLADTRLRASEFHIVCHFFGVPLDLTKMDKAFAFVTKERIANDPNVYYQAMNKNMLSDKYKKHRDEFCKFYTKNAKA